MLRLIALAILLLLCLVATRGDGAEISPSATAASPTQIEFPPPSGMGRLVIVISGKRGPNYYADYARRVAALGYDTVLLDGWQILSRDHQGGLRFEAAITQAQTSPHVVAGKAAVIGFSEGGGGALAYATRAINSVAVVVAYYPETAFLLRPSTNVSAFVGAFKVPVVAFAGARDSYLDCCRLTTIQSIDTTAKNLGEAFDLTVYPDAGHDFIKGADFRPADADDAWNRTVAALQRYLSS